MDQFHPRINKEVFYILIVLEEIRLSMKVQIFLITNFSYYFSYKIPHYGLLLLQRAVEGVVGGDANREALGVHLRGGAELPPIAAADVRVAAA